MKNQHEVLIIGAGVIGCSIAYHLARRGVTSCIVEKESVACRASGKAWAVIEHPAYYLAFQGRPGFWGMGTGETMAHWQDLLWSAYYRMADLSRDIQEKGNVDIEYCAAPSTQLAMSEEAEARLKQLMRYMEENGYLECEWLGEKEIKAVFPSIDPGVRGGLSIPQMQVEPFKYTLGLLQAAEAMGAEVRAGEIVGFEKTGNKVTAVNLASGGRIEADTVVIASGPWSKTVASHLGLDVPMTIVLEECVRVRPRKPFPRHSIAAGVEILARTSGDIVLAAAEVESIAQYYQSKGRPDFDATLREEVKTKNIEAAMALLPDLQESDLVEHRGDLLAYGPDPVYHKPVMGQVPGYRNVYIATRFGGLGIHQSVGAGEIMSDLIVDGSVPVNARHLLDHLTP